VGRSAITDLGHSTVTTIGTCVLSFPTNVGGGRQHSILSSAIDSTSLGRSSAITDLGHGTVSMIGTCVLSFPTGVGGGRQHSISSSAIGPTN
jgi:uncharacterized membrane protein YeiH